MRFPMASLRYGFLACVQLLLLLPLSRALSNGFTTIIEPGGVSCFYEKLEEKMTLDIEYQIVEGGGQMDISFNLVSPTGAVLIDDHKKTDEVHTVEVTEAGIYSFCFDNSFSTLAQKTVYADLGLDSSNEDEWLRSLPGLEDESNELQIESIRLSLENIKEQISKAQHYQSYLTKKLFKSHNVVKGSSRRVFWWSLIQSIALIGVGICQVLIVKNFFSVENSSSRI